jgi:superfamily II DNA or RNA helicase
MPRTPTLSFDRGTLILHPPPKGRSWVDYATWDDRVERFRVPALQYRSLVQSLWQDQVTFEDKAKAFEAIAFHPVIEQEPYPHQQAALANWMQSGRRGVVVLPTGAGKTFVAQLAMQSTGRSVLITVPTLDLMHQWYAHLCATFPDVEVGLLGGGSRDRTPVLVATYDSAAIQIESLGNRYGLLICDECHHLPTDFNRVIAEYAIAPYRLGLTATPDRSDGRHTDLEALLGPIVYSQSAADLAGIALADHDVVQIRVKLSDQERDRYEKLIATRNQFLQESNIWLGSLQGWQRFVQASAQSVAGRRAMLAHREARAIALGNEGKMRVLADLLAQHYPQQTLIFTNDNATAYRISESFLIPTITHQTPVKERHQILQHFRDGIYRTLVASHVLNEGVDVPEASVAILLSGTGSAREYIQRLGRVLRRSSTTKRAILYEVIAEETTEEQVSRRRHTPGRSPQTAQLTILPTEAPDSTYAVPPSSLPRAADDASSYDRNLPESDWF